MITGLIPNCSPEELKNLGRDLRDVSPRLLSGLYGGNTGNLAFVAGLRKIIGGPQRLFSWSDDFETLNNSIDQIVICCANQLGSHTDLSPWADQLAAYDKPVVAIGLGAQSNSYDEHPQISYGTLRFLEEVRRHAPSDAPNIATRGKFTSAVLERLGFESIPIGCPSVLAQLGSRVEQEIRARIKKTEIKIGVAAGNPWVRDTRQLEQTLISLLPTGLPGYFVQHPDPLLALAIHAQADLAESEMDDVCVWLGLQEKNMVSEWFANNSCLFTSVEDWMEHAKSFDLIIGTRFHGICLGLQAGVMGTVITIDARTKELCETTGIKSIPLQEATALEPEELVLRSRWTEADLDHYLRCQSAVARGMGDFFRDNRIEASEHATSLNGWQK